MAAIIAPVSILETFDVLILNVIIRVRSVKAPCCSRPMFVLMKDTAAISLVWKAREAIASIVVVLNVMSARDE